MKYVPSSKHLAFRLQIVLFLGALGAAVGLACLVAMAMFPLLAGIPGGAVIGAVAATALLVAFPVVLALTFVITRVSGQKRDLAAREELFVTAQQIGKFGYWHYDVLTEAFTLSDNVHELLGDPDGRLHLSMSKLLEMTNPDDRGELGDAFRRIIANGTCEEIEYRITGLDGVEKTFWVDGKRMLDRAGNPIRAYGACHDITEQKKTEAALHESKDHYRHAVELNAQIPWTADPEGNLLEMGPRWLEFIGMEREEALGTGWARALHPDDLTRALAVWDEALESGQPYDVEYRLCHTDGSYRWFRARAAARQDKEGSIIRWYGTLEDIHDRKTADAALRDSETFARSILDSTPDCIRVLDLAGNVQFMNRPGLQSLEIDDFEGRLKGRSWTSFWPGDAMETMDKALDTARAGQTAQFSGFCPTATGTPKWWDVLVSPIPGAEGKPDRLLVLSRDMTEAKQAQEEIERARRDAENAAQRLDNVLSSTRDCVITFDRQLRVVYLNKRAQEAIPGKRDIVGMMRDEAFPELSSTPFEEYLQKAFSQRETVHFEGYFAPYDRWLNIHIYPSADGFSVFFRDVTERRRAQEQLLYLAHHDTLTGLLNRTVLHERLTRSLAMATPQRKTALLFLDLDEFKLINDALGHSTGDDLLVQVSKRLEECVRGSDIVARFGGDEFAVVAEVNGPEEATHLAERIIGRLDLPYDLGTRTVSVGVSIGIVIVSDPGFAADDALRDADIALYQAKGDGRGSYSVFEAAMGDKFQEREALKQELRGAITRGEFRIDYQPLVNLRTNRVTGFEALLRWTHPTRGLVPPSDFIPLAEETGLILEIGEWVLGRACRDAATWPGGISVAVNLSPVQFRRGDLMQTVLRSLSESGLPGERLQLEITESVLLADSAANIEVLHALRKLGVAISMDDFGTGYSSLSYLRRFPFDKIKIDQSFVSDLCAEEGTGEPNAIVRAIIELARSFGIAITAEGVETMAQLSALRGMDCTEAQGFLISRPVGAGDVIRTITCLREKKGRLTPALRVVP